MGQQQLLLVILVTIIVGVATVVAINIFGESAVNANYDATRQDVLTLSAMAQGWYIKPGLMNGGGGKFTGITVDELGFGYDEDVTPTNGDFANENAEFKLDAGTAGQLTITAWPKQDPGGTVVAVVKPNEVESLTVTRSGDAAAAN